MRFILMLLFFLGSVNATANDYTVTVPINSANTDEVKQVARVKAQWKAALDLPVMVGGKSSVNSDGRYSEQIKALAVAALDVTTLSESWNYEQSTYTLNARVTLNEGRSAAMLAELASSKALQKQLDELHHAIIAVIESDKIDGHLQTLDAALDATRAYTLMLDEQSSREAQYALMKHFYKRAMDAFVTPIMAGWEYHVELDNGREMRIRVSNPIADQFKKRNFGWDSLGSCAASGLFFSELYRRGDKMFSLSPRDCSFSDLYQGTVYEGKSYRFTVSFRESLWVTEKTPRSGSDYYHLVINQPPQSLRQAKTNAEFTRALFHVTLDTAGEI